MAADGPAAALAAVTLALESVFGCRPDRASVSFVGVEPMEVLRFVRPGRGADGTRGAVVHVSLGMSRHPMTSAAQDVLTANGPRAELLVETGLAQTPRVGRDIWRSLAVLAAAPSVEGVVYLPGMTVDTGAALSPGSRCTGGLVVQSDIPAVEVPGFGAVEILQLLPATSTELAWSRVHGCAALRALWQERQVDVADLARDPVSLS